MQFDFANFDWSDDDSSPFDDYDDSSCCSDHQDEPVGCSCQSSSFSTIVRTRTIRFAEEDEIFEHMHLNDYTEEDINNTWFRPHEFRQMKSQILELVHRVEQQQPDTETLRGLEARTAEGSMKRSLHKREGYAAVLEEQQRQYYCGEDDPNRIAAVYQAVSSKCQGMATMKGLQDQYEARALNRSIVVPPKKTTPSSDTAEDLLLKPYEQTCDAARLAVLEDIKILSCARGATELALLRSNPAAA